MKTLDSTQHHKTANQRGLMHPVLADKISREFLKFATCEPRVVADIGCSYGNLVIALIER